MYAVTDALRVKQGDADLAHGARGSERLVATLFVTAQVGPTFKKGMGVSWLLAALAAACLISAAAGAGLPHVVWGM